MIYTGSYFEDDGDSINPMIASMVSSRVLVDQGSFGANETETIVPTDHPDVPYSTNIPLLYVGVILNSLAFIGCLLSIVFIVVFRKHRALTVAQPFFLGIIALTSAAVAASGILLEITVFVASNNRGTQKQLDEMCYFVANEFFGGSIILYMALFVKTWRLQKVTQLRRNQTVKCYHVLWPLFVADGVTSSVLVAWMRLAPPIWKVYFVETESIDQDGNEIIQTETFGYCEYGDNALFPLLMLALMSISAVLGYWMSTKIPASVPQELNDGKQIRLVYLIHFVILFGFDVVFLICRHFMIPILTSLTTLLLVFPFAFTVIALLIAPKCYSVFLDRAQGVGSGIVTVSGLNAEATTTNYSANASLGNLATVSDSIPITT